MLKNRDNKLDRRKRRESKIKRDLFLNRIGLVISSSMIVYFIVSFANGVIPESLCIIISEIIAVPTAIFMEKISDLKEKKKSLKNEIKELKKESRSKGREEVVLNINEIKSNNKELNVYDAMKEYLININNFSDKEQAFFELMNYIYSNLTNNNYSKVTSCFALCFWKTAIQIENKESFVKAIPREFKPSIESVGESMLDEDVSSIKGRYDENVYITFIVNYLSSKGKSRVRK